MEALLTMLGGVLSIAAYDGFWFAVFRKAGYESGSSMLMTIGMFIPLVNLGIAIYFVSTVWPVQSTLSVMRGQVGLATEADAIEALSVVNRLESRGDAAGAIAKYEEIMCTFEDSEAARDAEASIRSLKAKIG